MINLLSSVFKSGGITFMSFPLRIAQSGKVSAPSKGAAIFLLLVVVVNRRIHSFTHSSFPRVSRAKDRHFPRSLNNGSGKFRQIIEPAAQCLVGKIREVLGTRQEIWKKTKMAAVVEEIWRSKHTLPDIFRARKGPRGTDTTERLLKNHNFHYCLLWRVVMALKTDKTYKLSECCPGEDPLYFSKVCFVEPSCRKIHTNSRKKWPFLFAKKPQEGTHLWIIGGKNFIF